MKKIVSLFVRNYDGDRLVRNEIVPGAEWVAGGEGTATVKLDGTSCLFANGVLCKRYDAKHGKTPPPGFVPAQPEPDANTGHWPGWLKIGAGPEDAWHREALAATENLTERTYELIGPKVQSNPYGLTSHILVPHGESRIEAPRDFDGIRAFLESNPIEGIVWWRNVDDQDCEKVKIKAKDFGIKWPRK